jgi:hypothetical protein
MARAKLRRKKKKMNNTSGQAVQPTPESDVRQALNYNKEQVEYLDKIVEEIHTRLRGVLKTIPIEANNKEMAKSGNWGSCPISCDIYDSAHQIEGIRNRLSQIIDDLGV